MGSARVAKSLPLQVAAICYRRRGTAIEFLLVNTNGGNKWTFPKGSTDARLSHSQAAEREAAEEAGALGTIEPRHFHLYIHSKGVFWQPGGVQEFVVKAFLMEIHQMRRPDEDNRRPTWLSSGRSQAPTGQGARSEISPRTRSRDRPRPRTHPVPPRTVGHLSRPPQRPPRRKRPHRECSLAVGATSSPPMSS